MPDQVTDAVLFFEGDAIGKAMLLPEFEAVLDHVVSVSEYANQESKAVLVRVNSHLDVIAAVFFRLKFNNKGVADSSWNLPLDHMAGHSAPGPDMGSGKIRLGCQSQCCVPWHQKQLWDPVMRPDNNSFAIIRRAIKQNRLGLAFRVKPVTAAAQPAPQSPATPEVQAEPTKTRRSALEQSQRDRVALLIKQQRLHIATLNSQRNEEVQRMQQALQRKCSAYEKELAEKNAVLQLETERACRAQRESEQQVLQAEQDRQRYSQQLQQFKQGDAMQLNMLQEQLQRDYRAKLEAHTAELQEMLQMREVELYYRDEQLGSLRDEIGDLRKERLVLLNQGANNYLARLKEAGITFVAQHPGAGHITVALEDMGRYLDAPLTFAAEKCFVDTEHYRKWLQHYQQPTCRADLGAGKLCEASVQRIEMPNEFVAAYSDLCPQHREPAERPLESENHRLCLNSNQSV